MMGHEMDHQTQRHTSAQPPEQPEPLLDVLRRRYAAGEISGDQLEEMKRVLGLSSAKTEAAAGSHAHAWEAG
jgi:uncharacterized membrane protein